MENSQSQNSIPQDSKIPFNIPSHLIDELLSSKRVKHNENNNHLFSTHEIETVDFKELDEEINFMPLSEGLGFNKKEEVKTQAVLEKRMTQNYNKITNQNISLRKELDNTTDRADLSPFYNNIKAEHQTHPLFSQVHVSNFEDKKIETKSLVENLEKNTEYFTTPTLQEQFYAWAVDMIFILSLLSISIYATLSLLGFYNPVDWTWFKTTETLTFIMPFFVIYYLLYFTLMEREGNSSIGKQLFKLKVMSTNNHPVDFPHSFLRSAITLLSTLSFGLPLFLDFQGKLSDTKVVKRD